MIPVSFYLPDANSLLAKEMSNSAIAAANSNNNGDTPVEAENWQATW